MVDTSHTLPPNATCQDAPFLRGWWWQKFVAGFTGTGPMTAFMLLTQRLLPKGQQYALPPEIITQDVARRLHWTFHLNKGQLLLATTAAHFGYGAVIATLYQPLEKRLSLPAAMKGALFGFLIWAGSYLALLPIGGSSESAPKEPLQRNLLMILAHLIWGSTLGLVSKRLEQGIVARRTR